ncbi:hypothetical protein RSOLAG1IB_07797 [Rhizoctonia solani AG-1 IB]|uniref:Uncharacterized protein n=1 Tax=Thanatephorus cucumeris (strain AG1-IB / isolate 7/3/14) TaxID=1108050 RepID=A0A0B7FEE0_THACB|nr:hypothetical protein RSOLAG1IB_07797 [Rhizoctonia solani AG-1 IB]
MMSSEISTRMTSSWSKGPSSPLAMKFHRTWQDPNCPVWQWYLMQSQARSSTQFFAIQHWRSTTGPFFHEYLLILVEHGDICRIERMGEGSRNDAIKPVGCVAHDVIQWFSPSDYRKSPASQEPAELICQVCFPRTFDVLDVLAICYSIQIQPESSKYTLQRYNCYFLCLTVLTILVRRVGQWEGALDAHSTWSATVDQVVNAIQEKSTKNLGPRLHGCLEIFRLLDPEHHNPRGLILDSIRNRLFANGLESWRQAISQTLWADDIDSEQLIFKYDGFAKCITEAVEEMFASKTPLSRRLAFILDFDHRNEHALRETNLLPELVEEIDRAFQSSTEEYLLIGLHRPASGELENSLRYGSSYSLKSNIYSWFYAFCIYSIATVGRSMRVKPRGGPGDTRILRQVKGKDISAMTTSS